MSSWATVRAVSAAALALVQAGEFGELHLGLLASSRFSLAIRAFSESRWLDTETYSPRAILIAPATSPAMPR